MPLAREVAHGILAVDDVARLREGLFVRVI